MTWQRALNKALGLENEGQDWGIENADPERVLEFIEFFENHVPGHPWEPEALAELIIQSAQEALESKLLSSEAEVRVRSFFIENWRLFPVTAEQWLALNQLEWQVVRLLRKDPAGA